MGIDIRKRRKKKGRLFSLRCPPDIQQLGFHIYYLTNVGMLSLGIFLLVNISNMVNFIVKVEMDRNIVLNHNGNQYTNCYFYASNRPN